MFRTYLTEWENDLKAWTQWCKGGEEERKTLQATGGLVAQADVAPRRGINPTLSDAPGVPGPPGLSPQAADRLQVLEQRSEKCARVIAELKRVIIALSTAQQTGAWDGQSTLTYVVFAEKRWISRALTRVSRGESVDVLEISGEWWRVRTRTGVEGWVQRAVVAPKPPVQLWHLKDFGPGPAEAPMDRSMDPGAGRG